MDSLRNAERLACEQATAAHSMALSKEGAKPFKLALANAKNMPTHVEVSTPLQREGEREIESERREER
jgi:hypothetical protein